MIATGAPAKYSAVAVFDTDQGPFNAIYVEAAGNISIRQYNGDMTFVGLQAGNVYPFAGTRVLAAGTTIAAGSIKLLWN